MIVDEKDYACYLGKHLEDLEGKVSDKNFKRLKGYEGYSQALFGVSVVDYLFLAHQRDGQSLRELSSEMGLDKSGNFLREVLKRYKIPVLNPAEGSRRMLSERWKDEDFRQRNAEGVRRNWHDEGFRQRNAEGVRSMLSERWKDEGFRQRNAEGVRSMLSERWKDEGFRQRKAEGVRRNWHDEDFRQRNAEGVRRARLDPRNLEKYHLPTIKGYRKDIDAYAQSAWEANLARIFSYVGKKFWMRQEFKLKITEEYKELFKASETERSIDFVVEGRRGKIKLYEIFVPQAEDEARYAKLELMIQQYPEYQLQLVTQRKYCRLEKYFEDKINADSRFSGWETSGDNLRTNPEKYGGVTSQPQVQQ